MRYALLIVVILLLPLTGCTSSEDPRGTRVPVQGQVMLDGRPLDRARILFHAADGHDPITATGSIVNGQYQIPAQYGPLVGTMRVEIRPQTIDLAEFEAARAAAPHRSFSLDTVRIPARYHQHSELVANVTADEAQNIFNFELKSR